MSSKLEPVIWLRDTGHTGIHGGVDGRTIDDVMAKKLKFLALMGYHIFLRTVPTTVIAHTFYASPDTRISYRY